MEEVRLRMICIDLNDDGFSRGRSESHNMLMLFGPVECGVIWELVADAELLVIDSVPFNLLDLTQSQAIAGHIDDQKTLAMLCRVW
jgi:hypothetical protein